MPATPMVRQDTDCPHETEFPARPCLTNPEALARAQRKQDRQEIARLRQSLRRSTFRPPADDVLADARSDAARATWCHLSRLGLLTDHLRDTLTRDAA